MRMRILQSVPILSKVSEKMLVRLASVMRVQTFSAGDYIITENASVQAEFMFTHRGNKPTADSPGTGGARQLGGTQTDDIEKAVDAGINSRRGPLDFPGLISAAYS